MVLTSKTTLVSYAGFLQVIARVAGTNSGPGPKLGLVVALSLTL
jgi:hypothetical protein